MANKKPTIFISYSWNDSDKVDEIEEAFKKVGINITRDVNDLKYKDDLPSFMKSVREHDYCLLFISDAYLKSKNCLTELIEFSKENDFTERILPIYDDVDIFNQTSRMEYIEYWDDYSKKLQAQINSANPLKYSSEIVNTKRIKFISLSISDFLQLLTEKKLVSFEECRDSNFKPIFEYLEIDKDRIKSQILEIDNLNDVDEKEAEIERLSIKYPDNDLIIYYKAYIESVNRDNPKKAQILWEDYLERNPEDVLALGYLSFVYKNLNKPNEAVNILSKALEIEPDNYVLHKNMGSLLFLVMRDFETPRDYEKVIHHLEKAANGNPDDHDTFYKLGEVYLQGLFAFDNALECYKRSINLKPDELLPYAQSIAILTQQKRFKEAERLINKAKTYFPKNEKILTAEATLLIESGKDVSKGINLLFKLTEEYPKSFMTYIQLSKYLVELRNDYDSAIRLLHKAKKIVDEKKYIDIYLKSLIEEK